MKMKLLLILLTTFTLMFAAYADVPHVMNFQGKATDKQGAPLNSEPGTNFDLIFRIYDAERGGTLLWTERHVDVNIKNGIFQVLLGSVDPAGNPLDLPFDKAYWVSVEIGTDGEMEPRTPLTSASYAYKAEKATQAETASSISIPFYIKGLELRYEDSLHIKVTPGAIDIYGKILLSRHFSPNINILEVSNYIEGCSNPEPWIYVYVHSNNKEIKYVLADKAPDKSDYEGNTDDTKRYYIHNDIAYRCIGAVRTDSGGRNGALLRFVQRGNLVMWDVPINITKAPKTSWFTQSCFSGMPSISIMGIFGLLAYHAEAQHAGIAIRPSGSTWNNEVSGSENAISTYDSESLGIISGQRWCATNNSQQIDYKQSPGPISCAIDVEGYVLNIR